VLEDRTKRSRWVCFDSLSMVKIGFRVFDDSIVMGSNLLRCSSLSDNPHGHQIGD
jgi:hypothetical protein